MKLLHRPCYLLAPTLLLLAAVPASGISVQGTVTAVGAQSFVLQTADPQGSVTVQYPGGRGVPGAQKVIVNDVIVAVGAMDAGGKLTATSITCLVAGMPGASEYYVSATGSDTLGDGSSQKPWLTLSHAAAALTLSDHGTIVHVAPGVYDKELSIPNLGAYLNRSGTPTARLRFISDAPRQARIVNAAGLTAAVFTTGSYLDIVNFDISAPFAADGIDMAPNPAEQGTGMGMFIFGNRIHDIGNASSRCLSGGGIAGSGPSGVISGNLVTNVGNPSVVCNQQHGIYVSSFTSGGAGSGAWSEPGGWVIQNNLVANILSYGIHLYHFACNDTVTNNTVLHAGYAGILINFQTAAGCDGGENTISNNLIVNNGWQAPATPAIREYNGGGPGNVFANNLLAGNSTNTIQILAGNPVSTNNLYLPRQNVAGLFLNYRDDGSGDYHLAAGSPAISAGASAPCVAGKLDCVPLVDLDGTARSSGEAIDIGAYAYSAPRRIPRR